MTQSPGIENETSIGGDDDGAPGPSVDDFI